MYETPSSGADTFVHLHNHTEYSMLDGAAKVDDLFAEAARMGMPALAITDHGYLFGAYEFWRASKKHGVKPIIGLEAYLTPGTARGDRTRVRWGVDGDDDVSGGGAYTHMTLWAQTDEGLHNLLQLGSIASLEGGLSKPRLDRELLQSYSAGLIAASGCAGGEIPTRLRLGQDAEAAQAAADFRDIFGDGNFYFEVMYHGLPVERTYTPQLIDMSKRMGIQLVATNDLHYTKRTDADAHSALLCIQTGTTLDDPNRFKFDTEEFFLKSPEDMRRLWGSYPEACDNTLAIAERCTAGFENIHGGWPQFKCPPGEDAASWMVKEIERGLAARYPGGVSNEVRERVAYETRVIIQMGFPSYMLLVADLVAWAKAQGIRVGPGRGSGAGSVVVYALGITDVDPLRHGLMFERFLNPDRVSPPDIDLDFDERRRDEVVKYVTNKYGSDRVAQVITFGSIKARQAIRDSARVLSRGYSEGDALSRAIPPDKAGRGATIAEMFDQGHSRYAEAEDFRELAGSNESLSGIVDMAGSLEGLKRQWGVHPCALIVAEDPIVDHVPIMKRPRDGAIITQFDFDTCDSLGLLKVDLLGLKNLSVLDRALANIKENRGRHISLLDLINDPTDRATYEMLSSGETLGVFQLDSRGMRQLLRTLKPESFGDISAVIALYRPGPIEAGSHTNHALRKNGLQPVTPIHPEMAEPLAAALEETYGLVVYQEQVMSIARSIAGYTLAQADILRRVMAKKKRGEVDREYQTFHSGALQNGYSEEAVSALWSVLLPFSDYAFNKAHSVCYGMISYCTAYLKANYPAEYMAALLTGVQDDMDKAALYLGECRRMGVGVLPPDINISGAEFTAAGPNVTFGLASIKNVGSGAVEEILQERNENGPYASLFDLMFRTRSRTCTKRAYASLIKAGAFDSLGGTRRGLYGVVDKATIAVANHKRRAAAKGITEGVFESIPFPQLEEGEWGMGVLLDNEREALGCYVSGHPLRPFECQLASIADHFISDIILEDGPADGEHVKIAGVISAVSHGVSRKGVRWGKMLVEDLSGIIEARLFGKSYRDSSAAMRNGVVVALDGYMDRGADGASVRAVRLKEVELRAENGSGVTINLPASYCSGAPLARLKEILSAHPGTVAVRLRVSLRGPGREVIRLGQTVTPSPKLYADIDALLKKAVR
jgi:DNA polymerase III subunit alpha